MASEVDDFLESITKDGSSDNSDPFVAENQNPFGDEPEPKEEIVEEKEEKPLPFHKDPKIQRFIEKEIERRIPQSTETERFKKEVNENAQDDLVKAFEEIIGNDTPQKVNALKALGKRLAESDDKVAQRAIQALEDQRYEESRAEQQAEYEAQEELTSAFEGIEETFGVDLSSNNPNAKKLRNDYIDFVKKVAPKDGNGEVTEFPDFQETFQLFKDTRKPAANNRAKELSARSMVRSSDASNTPRPTDNSWNAVDKLFSKLN